MCPTLKIYKMVHRQHLGYFPCLTSLHTVPFPSVLLLSQFTCCLEQDPQILICNTLYCHHFHSWTFISLYAVSKPWTFNLDEGKEMDLDWKLPGNNSFYFVGFLRRQFLKFYAHNFSSYPPCDEGASCFSNVATVKWRKWRKRWSCNNRSLRLFVLCASHSQLN